MSVIWFHTDPPATKFANVIKCPLYKTNEGSTNLIQSLKDQILSLETQVNNEELVSPVPFNNDDPYPYTRHWKQHNLFWDSSALEGEHLQRFEMTGELEKMFHIVRKNYLLFLKELNYPRIKVYIHAWANVLREGQWISRHMHMSDENAYLSGTYYLTTVPTVLSLINPIRTDHAESFKTQAGNLIFFPSWLPHESTVYHGTDYRISLAFDIVTELNMKSNPWRPHVLFDDPETMEGFEMYLKDRTLTS